MIYWIIGMNWITAFRRDGKADIADTSRNHCTLKRYPETIELLDGLPSAPHRPGCETRTHLFSESKSARPGPSIRIEQTQKARSSSGALYEIKKMETAENSRAAEAANVLNDFIGDFITGVMVFREYSQQYQMGKMTLEAMVPIQKMCFSNIVLAFAKFEEFWNHYHELIPQKYCVDCKNILKSLRARKVKDFRNKCVGHIWDKEKHRPLAHSEVMCALSTLAAPDFDSFLNWVNTPRGNVYPNTVVSIVEAVRDALILQHDLLPEEVINR
jgi:hypothetical protein